MLYSPRWLFLMPGMLLALLGLVGYGLVFTRTPIGPAQPDAHTLLVCSLFILMGYQSALIGTFAKVFAIGERLMPMKPRMKRWFTIFTLERGLAIGAVSFLSGVIVLLLAFLKWANVDFGALDYAETMRAVIPGVTLATLGFQTILGSFFLSVLGMRRK